MTQLRMGLVLCHSAAAATKKSGPEHRFYDYVIQSMFFNLWSLSSPFIWPLRVAQLPPRDEREIGNGKPNLRKIELSGLLKIHFSRARRQGGSMAGTRNERNEPAASKSRRKIMKNDFSLDN